MPGTFRLVALAVLAGLLASACTSTSDEAASPEPAPSATSASDPGTTLLDAAEIAVELRPAEITIPDELQVPDPTREELFVSRILADRDAFRVVGLVEDDVSRLPVVIDLDADATTASRQDLAVPDGIAWVGQLDVSQDEQHIIGIGIRDDRSEVGLLWRADRVDEVTILPDARTATDAVEVGVHVLVVGTVVGDARSQTVTVWSVGSEGVDIVTLEDAPDGMEPTVIYHDEGRLHVWGNLPEEDRPALLTTDTSDPADLRQAPLPDALDNARTVEGSYADDNIGRYLVGSRPDDALFHVAVWQRTQGRWIDQSGALPQTGTSSGFALGEINGFYYVSDAYGEIATVWRAAGAEVLEDEGATVRAEVLAWRTEPGAASLSYIEGGFRLDGEPVDPSGLPSPDDVQGPQLEVVAADVAAVSVPPPAGVAARTAIVSGGEVLEVVDAYVHAVAPAANGDVYLVGDTTQVDGSSDVAVAYRVRGGEVMQLELPVEEDITSRLTATMIIDGAMVLLGHTYRNGAPELLALTVADDGTVQETALADSGVLPGARSRCGPRVATFDGELTAGLLRPASDSGAALAELGATYDGGSAPLKCAGLDDGRLVVALTERILVVDGDEVVDDARVRGLRFGGRVNGASVQVAGRDAVMFLVGNPDGAGTAVALVPVDDPARTVFLPVDVGPGTVVNTVAQPDPGRLLVSVREGRRTSVREIVLAS